MLGGTTRKVLGAMLAAGVVSMAVAGCRNGALGRQYEYEEEMYLDLDGSVSVMVNASLDALVVLRGAVVDPDPEVRFDRDVVRAFYACPGADVKAVSRPWRRAGRRFVHIQVDVDDVAVLAGCRAFAWSTYALTRENGSIRYAQRISAPVASVPAAGWSGDELVAFRMHLPSRITFHNAPSRQVERGNIVNWEQSLRSRLAGEVVEIDVRMDERSILRRTLTVFGLAAAVAVAVLATAIWWVVRKGRQRRGAGH